MTLARVDGDCLAKFEVSKLVEVGTDGKRAP
jgi:hypothetical protein